MENKKTITTNNRSRYVVDCDYGKITALEKNDIDLPKMSKIDFDEDGNLISCDFSELDYFLKYQFIPEHIKVSLNGVLKNKHCIPLSSIIKLRLSEIELKYAIDYLGKQNIFVSGFSSVFDGEFENYDYKRNSKAMTKVTTLPKPLEDGENERLINQYRLTGDSKYRDKVIEHNLRLVLSRSVAYSLKSNIPVEELESYGSEALIKAVDEYDSSKSKFSTFAYNKITWSILNAIKKISSKKKLSSINVFSDERYAELENHQDIIYEYYHGDLSKVNDEVIFSLANGAIDNFDLALNEELDYIEELISFYEIKKEVLPNISTDDSTSKCVIEDYMKNQIAEILNQLPIEHKFFIEHRFGFNGHDPKSLDQMGKLLGITRAGASKKEKKILKKLRSPSIKRKLDGYLK